MTGAFSSLVLLGHTQNRYLPFGVSNFQKESKTEREGTLATADDLDMLIDKVAIEKTPLEKSIQLADTIR